MHSVISHQQRIMNEHEVKFEFLFVLHRFIIINSLILKKNISLKFNIPPRV